MGNPFDPTSAEIERAAKIIKSGAKENGTRTLDDEREFMENLLVARLNFLFVVFAIFVAAGFSIDSFLVSAIVFFVGSVLCWMMALLVHRAHVKHHWIMRLFYEQKLKPEELPHVIQFANEAMKASESRKNKTKGSVSVWAGVYIPRACWLFLALSGLICFALFFLEPLFPEYFAMLDLGRDCR